VKNREIRTESKKLPFASKFGADLSSADHSTAQNIQRNVKNRRENERERERVMAHVIIDRSDAVKKRLAIVGAADGWWSECGGRKCRRHLCSNTTQEG
jgi:hypothetical protein